MLELEPGAGRLWRWRADNGAESGEILVDHARPRLHHVRRALRRERSERFPKGARLNAAWAKRGRGWVWRDREAEREAERAALPWLRSKRRTVAEEELEE